MDLLQCQGAIWELGGVSPDGRPHNSLGYRGVLSVELSVEIMSRDAHSGYAHILPNAAWRLNWALSSIKGPDERVLIPGFYDRVKPPSATDLELLDALPDHEAMVRDMYGPKHLVRGLSGKELNRAVFEPTCNIQGITTGYQGRGNKTVIPALASAKVDLRLVPDQDPRDIFDKLRAHLDHQGFGDVQLTWSGAIWPAKTDPNSPLVKLSSRTGEEVYGQPSLLEPLNGGSTPVYAFANPLGGIPVISAGVSYWGSRIHAPDEHIRIEDFLQGARHIARILDGFAASPTVA